MPAEFERYGESFQRLHPAWQMKLWTEQNLPPLRNRREFEAAKSMAQKADILRYELLFEHGGVYLDTDFECLQPLDALLEGVAAFSASEDAQWISIGIMGALPHHPLFGALVEELPASLAARPAAPINEQTGPLFFTRVATARRLKRLDEDFVVYPPRMFYPYSAGQEHLRHGPFPGAYAVHHWAGSWLKESPKKSAPLTTAPSLARKVGSETPRPSREQPVRVLLGLDPEQPQAALSVLLTFHRLFGPEDPVELAIFAYAEPSLHLLDCIQALMRSLVGDPEQTAGLSLLSRAELAEVPYRTAFFPAGDEVQDALAMAALLSELHAIRVELGGEPRRSAAVGLGRDELLRRAARHPQKSSPAPSLAAEAPPQASEQDASSHVPASGVYGTGLGDGRVLTKTRAGYPILSSARDLSLTPELVLHGEYDRPLSRFLESRLAPGNVAFDVGANIGLFSVAMARLVGPSGHVVAYEAADDNHRFLVDNISMNYLTGHCTLLRQAVWSEACELTFFAPESFLGNGSLTTRVEDYMKRYPGDSLREIKVQAVALEEELARHDSVALVKIDVEGAEYRVLQGMDRALRSGRVRCVVFECLASLLGDDFASLVKYLAELERDCGLQTRTIDPRGATHPLPLAALAQHGNFTQVALSRWG